MVNKLSTQDMQVRSLGQEDPMEKKMATHSSTFCLDNPMDGGAWRATVCKVAKESDHNKVDTSGSVGCRDNSTSVLA